jgi:queuine tRNA-ribosyltransferase
MTTDEPLGPRLLALHNLTFLLELMRECRMQLQAGNFRSWSTVWLARYRATKRTPSVKSVSP